MASHIKSISVKGLHRTATYPGKDFELEFGPGVNVVYGHNGSGKTTLLHILTNLCNGTRPDGDADAVRKFQYLDFNNVSLITDRHGSVRICKDNDDNIIYRVTEDSKEKIYEIRNLSEREYRIRLSYELDDELDEPDHQITKTLDINLPRVAYFPAYRSLGEIQHLLRELPPRRILRRRRMFDNIFGRFTPDVDMMSLSQIESGLSDAVREVVADVARQNRRVLSRLSIDVLSTLQWQEILRETSSLRKQLREIPMYNWLPEVAAIYDQIEHQEHESSADTSVNTATLYKDALSEILDQQTDRYADIDRFLKNVNQFLIDKYLVIRPQHDGANRPQVGIQREGDSNLIGIDTMSSGERQIVSLLHAASFLGERDLVLIDEPEISLHIDWQYQFGTAISEILADKQLIMCTHSPDILTALENAGGDIIELDPSPVGRPTYLHEAEDIQR